MLVLCPIPPANPGDTRGADRQRKRGLLGEHLCAGVVGHAQGWVEAGVRGWSWVYYGTAGVDNGRKGCCRNGVPYTDWGKGEHSSLQHHVGSITKYAIVQQLLHAVRAACAVQHFGLTPVCAPCCAVRAASPAQAPWLWVWPSLWQAQGGQPQQQHVDSAAASPMPSDAGAHAHAAASTTARAALANPPPPSQLLSTCRQRRPHGPVPSQALPPSSCT